MTDTAAQATLAHVKAYAEVMSVTPPLSYPENAEQRSLAQAEARGNRYVADEILEIIGDSTAGTLTDEQIETVQAVTNILDSLIRHGAADPQYWMKRAVNKILTLIPTEQRVLDPQPYEHRAYGDRSEVPLTSYMFMPRSAYVQDSAQYPYEPKSSPLIFSSRSPMSLNGDPKPWLYVLLGEGDENFTPAREATQLTGGFIYSPRPKYNPVLTHPTNPILTAFRNRDVLNGTAEDAAEWMKHGHHRNRMDRGKLANEITHAERVLSRLANWES